MPIPVHPSGSVGREFSEGRKLGAELGLLTPNSRPGPSSSASMLNVSIPTDFQFHPSVRQTEFVFYMPMGRWTTLDVTFALEECIQAEMEEKCP